MNPNQLSSFLARKGFAVKQVPLLNTLGKLGKDGVNTFNLTSNFCDNYIGSKFWTCSYCSKMFDSQMALNNHIRLEHYGRPLSTKREPDGERLSDPSSFLSAVDSDKDETSYIIIRTEPSVEEPGYKRRIRRPETKPRKQYERKADAFFKVEVDGPFTCNQCRESFDECCNFSLHMNTVHFKRRRLILRCQICEKKFTGKGYGDNLEVPPEQAAGSLTCELCSKTFSLQAHLDHHQRKHHSQIKPYECSLCSKSFTQITGLTQHMKTHSGIKPFVCTVCSKPFRQKAGLDQHMRIHSKIKPYNCLLCNRAFTQSAHLSQHMRIHTKIEPFECTLCNRRFKQSSHLNFHLRSHATGNSHMVVHGEPMYSQITITPVDPYANLSANATLI